MTRNELREYFDYYDDYIDREPENTEARLRLARVSRELGREDRAIEEYGQAARLLARSGESTDAIAACKAMLEIDPTHVAGQFLLASLYAKAPDAIGGRARAAQPVDGGGEVERPRREESSVRPVESEDSEEQPAVGGDMVAEGEEVPTEPETHSGEDASTYQLGADEMQSEPAEEEESLATTIEIDEDEREGIPRDEMEELLTTIDVEADDIVDIEDVEDIEGFEEEHGEEE